MRTFVTAVDLIPAVCGRTTYMAVYVGLLQRRRRIT